MDFDELIEIFDHIQDEKINFEIYVTSDSPRKIAFILPDDNEIWLSQEDAVKVFLLLGKALKSIDKVKNLKVTLEYEL